MLGLARANDDYIRNYGGNTSSVAKLRPYGSASQWSEFSGISVKFVDGGSDKSIRFVLRVKLSGLVPAARYEYMVG